MIGFIQGKVIYSDGKKAIILTNSGVGYELNYGYFLQSGSELGLYIHHHISENDESLWGFNNLEDKKMFELLKTVNKVGSSKAYPLVSTIGTKSLKDAILFEHTEVLTTAPGIGKKMAEQIILSLKDKLDKLSNFSSEEDHFPISQSVDQLSTPHIENKQVNNKLLQETIQALESLGYKDKDVMKIVQDNMDASVFSTEELLKRVLREL